MFPSTASKRTGSREGFMLNSLIIAVMLAILVSLGFGLYFLVHDSSEGNRTVISLSIRVGLAVVMLALLGYGFITRYLS